MRVAAGGIVERLGLASRGPSRPGRISQESTRGQVLVATDAIPRGPVCLLHRPVGLRSRVVRAPFGAPVTSSRRAPPRWWGVITYMLMVGCDEATSDAQSPASSSATPTIALVTSSSASVAAIGTASSAPAASALVSVPDAQSPRPAEQDWSSAPTFNTSTTLLRDDRCKIAILRDWMRVDCNGEGYLHTIRLEGSAGKDYWLSVGLTPTHDAYVGRLKRGGLTELSFESRVKPVLIRVAWPSDAAGPTVAEAASDPAGLQAVHPREPLPIPLLPIQPTERPRPGDWVSAVPVNTAPAERRPKACEAAILRNWLRWRCSGGSAELLKIEGLGKLGADHFVVNSPFTQEGEARLGPSMDGTVRIKPTFDGPVVALAVRWPVNEPRPTEVSFQTEK